MNYKQTFTWVTFLALLLTLLPSAGGIATHELAQPGATFTTATDISSQNMGTDFWLTFLGGNPTRDEVALFITGDVDTTGTVEIPGLGFSAPFSVTAGTVTTVALPTDADLGGSSDMVETKGVHITAQEAVTVYGLNRQDYSTDAFLGLPTNPLATEFIVLGYENNSAPVGTTTGTRFAIVGTEDGTTVTITPSVTTGGRTAGVPYDILLNQGETYQLSNNGPDGTDLSGTIIASDKPIAAFGGHPCAFVPAGYNYCDHLVEQLPPTVAWGWEFVAIPLATRLGDTFRFLASADGTNVDVNGTVVATLDRGEFHEQILSEPAHILADQPILVAQYANGTGFDDVVMSDPFMMLIPPFEQFLGSYTVTTPASGIDINFVNVAARNVATDTITLDGVPIPVSSFVPIGTSGFSGAQVPVSVGAHSLSSSDPFGVFVYGFDYRDSYGYPGDMGLAPVVIVTNLVLTPQTATNPVGTEHCVTATVTDQNDDLVEGVRVDFEVSGVNPTTGYAQSGANGEARFCYTGTNLGEDSIVASVGTITDTATKMWIDSLYSVYIPICASGGCIPPSLFPLDLGSVILKRPVVEQGEIFYSKSLCVSIKLPSDGHFYLSSQPDAVAPVMVDDELAILLNGVEVFTYDFSTSGIPEPATVEVPRETVEQMVGQMVTIEYRDIYSVAIQATPMWLIWGP